MNEVVDPGGDEGNVGENYCDGELLLGPGNGGNTVAVDGGYCDDRKAEGTQEGPKVARTVGTSDSKNQVGADKDNCDQGK